MRTYRLITFCTLNRKQITRIHYSIMLIEQCSERDTYSFSPLEISSQPIPFVKWTNRDRCHKSVRNCAHTFLVEQPEINIKVYYIVKPFEQLINYTEWIYYKIDDQWVAPDLIGRNNFRGCARRGWVCHERRPLK